MGKVLEKRDLFFRGTAKSPNQEFPAPTDGKKRAPNQMGLEKSAICDDFRVIINLNRLKMSIKILEKNSDEKQVGESRRIYYQIFDYDYMIVRYWHDEMETCEKFTGPVRFTVAHQ